MKYILVPFAMLVSVFGVSVAFAAASEDAASKSNGDATAAEPASMNCLLVKFELLFDIILHSPLLTISYLCLFLNKYATTFKHKVVYYFLKQDAMLWPYMNNL